MRKKNMERTCLPKQLRSIKDKEGFSDANTEEYGMDLWSALNSTVFPHLKHLALDFQVDKP